MTRQSRMHRRLMNAKLCGRNCGRAAVSGGRCGPCRRDDSDYMREYMRWRRGSTLRSTKPDYAHREPPWFELVGTHQGGTP